MDLLVPRLVWIQRMLNNGIRTATAFLIPGIGSLEIEM